MSLNDLMKYLALIWLSVTLFGLMLILINFKMKKKTTPPPPHPSYIPYVGCPNPIHIGRPMREYFKLYNCGDGTFKCDSCGQVFTSDEIKEEVTKDYNLRLRDVRLDYAQKLKFLSDEKE